MTTRIAPMPGTKRAKARSRPALAECWHHCPVHAALNPMWKTFDDAALVEEGVLWSHPSDDITKIDRYVRVCPSCRGRQHAVPR